MTSLVSITESAIASVASPTIDVSLLTAAPQAAILLQSLSILAACTIDVSLVNNQTTGVIKLLKTPGSFRGSLYQTSASMSNAFRTADQAMLRIKINLNDIPSVITSLINAYAKPGDSGSKFIMDLRMKNFEGILHICNVEAERARQKFDDTLELIQELVQAATATQGDNIQKNEDAKAEMAGYNKEKEGLQEARKRLEEDISDQKRRIEDAKKQYEKSAKKMTSIGHHLIGVVTDSIGTIMQGIKGVFSVVGKIGGSNKQKNNGGANSNNANGPLNPEDTSVAASGSSSYSQRLEAASHMAKDVYLTQQKFYMELLERDAKTRKEMAELAKKLATLGANQLNLEEIIMYLAKGVGILARVQEQWGKLQTFFASLESSVMGPMRRHLSDFGVIVQANDIGDSELLRQELAKSGINAAAICLSVSRAAHIYNRLSKIYVLPLVDKAVAKMIMTQEEAKAEALVIEQQMEKITHDSQNFIDKELQESEKTTVKQIMQTRDAFLSIFGITSPPRLR